MRIPSKKSWKRQQLRGKYWSCAFHSSPLTFHHHHIIIIVIIFHDATQAGFLSPFFKQKVQSKVLLESVWAGWILLHFLCVCVYSNHVARGYSGPICVIVLLVDIKSRAMLARRGCAFVRAQWRECAIVHWPIPLPLFLLYLSAYFVRHCACICSVCLSECPHPLPWQCVCVCVRQSEEAGTLVWCVFLSPSLFLFPLTNT